MAHHSAAEGDDTIQGINVTPLVDIIFMVASQVGKVLDLELQLPRAASAEATPPPTLTIEVDQTGGLKLDGRPIDQPALEAAVRRAAAANPEAQAMVAADQRVAYSAVMVAVDAVRLGGIRQLGLQVRDGAAP
jgi:biopolymer transport protein ExbD